MIEFRTSELALERIRQRFKVIRIFFQSMLIGLAIFLTYMNLKLFSLPYGLSFFDIFLFLMPIGIVVFALVAPRFQKAPLKNLETQRVRLLPQRIERSSSSGTEHLEYKDIKSLQVHRNGSGELVSLTLNSKRQNMQLDSLEHLDALLEGLRAVLPDVTETEKKHRLTMETNRSFFLVMLAGGAIGGAAVLILLKLNPGQRVNDVLQALLLLIPAVIILARRPTSNSMMNVKAARRHGFFQLGSGLLFLGLIIWQIFF